VKRFRWSTISVRLALPLVLLSLMAITSGCGDDDDEAASPATEGASVTISQGDLSERVRIEIAATYNQRQQGLMFRQEMAEDAGMLFVFAQDVRTGFWMKNTYLPLDIAYIGADGRVQEVRQAKPLDETVLTPGAPYRYVIELNQGWFERHNMGIGARVTLPDNLPAAE
jgi:uncharacterized membrane protein (UPF0127 family)